MDWLKRHSFWLVMAAGALALAAAHFSEQVLAYAPCPLCLDQREAVWAALLIGAVGWYLHILKVKPFTLSLALMGVGAAYLYGAWIAGFHSGVEWGIFEPPPSCTGTNDDFLSNPDNIAAALEGVSSIPSCAAAPFRLVGLSMANANFILMLCLGILSWFSGLSELIKLRRIKP